MYGLYKTFKKADKYIALIEKLPEWAQTLWWRLGFPMLFLYVVIGIVHKFVDFMNWITS
jgi:hypothetical protein